MGENKETKPASETDARESLPPQSELSKRLQALRAQRASEVKPPD
jgi:hypothetical protein